jgi:hypothetical protein
MDISSVTDFHFLQRHKNEVCPLYFPVRDDFGLSEVTKQVKLLCTSSLVTCRDANKNTTRLQVLVVLQLPPE